MNEMWREAVVAGFGETMKRIVLFLPKIMALVTFLVLGLAIGWLVKFLLLRMLKTIRFDQLCERLGLAPALAKIGMKQPVSLLIGRLSFWTMFLLFTFMGIDALDLPAAANLMNGILAFFPHVLAAIFVALIGALLANFIGESTLIAAVNAQIQEARLIANLIRWGVLIFTAAMVLTQLGIAMEIVVAAFSITFGGIMLSLAIALGLGGSTIAKDALERRLHRKTAVDEVPHI